MPLASVEGALHIVRYVNPAFCRLLNKTRDELVGKPFPDVMQEKDDFLTLLDQVYQSGKFASHQKQRHAEPHPVFWSYTIWPVLVGGNPVGVMIQVTEIPHSQEQMLAMNEALVFGSLRQHELAEASDNLNTQKRGEITAREQTEEALRESDARFRIFFDQGPIAMYTCDAAGTTREYNYVAMELWGLDPARANTHAEMGGSFKILLPDGTFLPYAETPMTRVLTGELPAAHDMHLVIERPNGSRIDVIANIAALKNDQGDITGAINCFYDITERSRLERQTMEQAQALTDLHRRKDEFLAMLSHELRNPLAPISNAVHLLRMQKNESPIQSQARGIIERQVAQMVRLIDDLMEVSRISTGKIHLVIERLALNGIVENALESVRSLIEKHHHSLELTLSPQPIWLDADASRLEQVVVNLLTNAAKYTETGGSIWLSVQQEGYEAVLRVRDSGVGISAELLPHVFDLFTQAERSLARSEGGLGIGLCLVQRLVDLHRGSVKAYSALGEGSEFVVRLPVMGISQLASFPVEKISPVQRSLRVLVVEDNVDAAETMAWFCKRPDMMSGRRKMGRPGWKSHSNTSQTSCYVISAYQEWTVLRWQSGSGRSPRWSASCWWQ